MPRVAGMPELGGNRVHVSEVDGWVEYETELIALPAAVPTTEEIAIAEHVTALIEPGSTLQFGIGAVPDEIAQRLAAGPLGDFGVHTEMISDGVMQLHRAGKVTNRKGLYDGVTVATFALGSGDLYAWLADHPVVPMLPVPARQHGHDTAAPRPLGGDGARRRRPLRPRRPRAGRGADRPRPPGLPGRASGDGRMRVTARAASGAGESAQPREELGQPLLI